MIINDSGNIPSGRKFRHSSQQHHKCYRKNYLDWLDGGPYNHARSEMALWVAVITQTMMDALNKATSAETTYCKNEAIHWLTSNSRDFITVCLYAGLNPDYVRRKAKRALIAPSPWRAAPGKGKRYQERKAYRQSLKTREKVTPEIVSGPEPCPIIPSPHPRA